jgi:hypothetical protein
MAEKLRKSPKDSENRRKSPLLAKIAENIDHYDDPWFRTIERIFIHYFLSSFVLERFGDLTQASISCYKDWTIIIFGNWPGHICPANSN